MKVAVIVFPGSNCDRDVCVAVRSCLATEPLPIWHRETSLPKVDLIVIPGGFSYGDYLRPGAIAGHSPIMREVIHLANAGVPVLGICNGFQILTETGLLPGILMRNANLRFACRDVWLRIENSDSIFTRHDISAVAACIPVAHHDGNYYADDDTLSSLEDENRIAFRYCDKEGKVTNSSNPNGSRNHIAGILSKAGNVLGMMPHPERAISFHLGSSDGANFFRGISRALEA